MAVEIVRRLTCDWCGEGEDSGSIKTHRLVFDRVAREVELHTPCQDEATLAHLIDNGRKPTPAEIAAANNDGALRCPIDGCPKSGNGLMGLAQHLARSHGDIPVKERQVLLESIKESNNPG